ncbi:hypothetical protein [Natronomonas sp. LN261]|uniref:hypothetical protein n=1 Tax=Natronomonas sp. LN261 TaxID=2750669 RepID=UPI0015EEAEE2|nr:hypothetical protein [Natronomonas sp. LN261]
MPIEFERSVDEARLKSPLEAFETVTETVEHRWDPLTDRKARIVPDVFPDPEGGAETHSKGETGAALDALVGDSEGCFFCPDSIETATPEYPDTVGGGRTMRGEATAFPNLFPYAKHANVVVLTEEHFRPMTDLGPERLADGLACGLEYVRSVRDHEGSRLASINMNFLRSSGGSVFHPHMQVIADDHGTDRQARILRREREYDDEHDSRYWSDLLEHERSGDRYVGRTGGVEWVAPFAPLGQFHVAGVLDPDAIGGDDGVLSPDAELLDDLAVGIDGVLEYYADRGLNAFNFGLRFAPDDPASTPVLDIVARAPFEAYYVNDAFYAQTVHREGVVDVAPEVYASAVAEHVE